MKLKAPNLTWRTRQRLKTLFTVLGTTVVLAVVFWLCWLLWLGRFVVYARDGVRLDFDWVTPGSYVTAVEPTERPVTILYDDGSNTTIVERSKELESITGSYITLDMLTGDLAAVEKTIKEQPKGTAIMLELKSASGNFYYDTVNGTVSSKVDKDAMEALIAYLTKADYYTIACVPAFRDRAYGLENTSLGIHHSSGGYLWAGADKCYWLDPAKNGTRAHLIAIASELRDLGFDEVLFTDFCFPPTEDILYEDDKLTALNDAAQHLVYNLATEDFCISFLCREEGFLLPEGRTRLYLDGVDASMAQSVASGLTIPDAKINLVYLTEVNDTRFDAFSVLRPLPMGVGQLPPVDEPTQPTESPAGEPAE